MADTGLLSPAANGDDYSQWATPTNAYLSNNAYASPTAADQLHDYYNFTITIPAESTINGIEASLEGHAFNANGTIIGIELSWDGGANYTATGYAAAYPSTADETDVLGGAANLWGREAWAISEFTDANFRARVDSTGAASKCFLDHLQVKIYYTEATVRRIFITHA